MKDPFVSDLVNQLTSMIEATMESPEGIRSTATYQFMLQVRDRMVESGIPETTAEMVVAEMKIELAPDFHIDYHEEFNRLVEVFSKVIANIYDVVQEDYNDAEKVLTTFAKQFTVTF